jgi:hypothetical protein
MLPFVPCSDAFSGSDGSGIGGFGLRWALFPHTQFVSADAATIAAEKDKLLSSSVCHLASLPSRVCVSLCFQKNTGKFA